MAKTQEPNIVKGSKPEEVFRNAITAEIEGLLKDKLHEQLVNFFILQEFGLDIAVFMEWPNRSTAKFLEVKAFVGSRQGGVGFGNQQGEGLQVDLLMLDQAQLAIADRFAWWVLMDGTKPLGSARFVIFSNSQAHRSAMGGVRKGKQNNLRVSTLMNNAITWDELSKEFESFLTDS